MKPKDWDRIAADYFEHISSPFEKGAQLPIEKEIKKIKNRKNLIALDAGCGIGNLIPLLSRNFKKVIAFDFSKGMVEKAKEKSEEKEIRNAEISVMDMTKLSALKGKIDVAFSVNSLIMPDVRIVDTGIKEMHSSLKSKGKLIAVFPSLESVLFESMLVYESLLLRYENEKKAAKMTKRVVGKQYYDFYTGMIDIEGKQKHFYEFEIEYRLKKAGFKNIRIGKVFYPWETVQDVPLPKDAMDAKVWDWFVVAEK